MSIIVVSGLSGAGKSVTSKTLEDIGYYVIDNLPPVLLSSISKLNVDSEVAVVIDSRSREMFDSVLSEFDKLKYERPDSKLLYLHCDDDVLLGRYKYTRRAHPLISDDCKTLEEAINKEIKLFKNIRAKADIEIDTTHLNNAQLRKTIIDTFNTSSDSYLTIKVISFGYKNGLPMEADLVYDVRCMPNPFYKEELRDHNGTEDCVYDYVFSFEQSNVFADKVIDFINYSLPYYIEEGKNELVIAIGCTSGHHRSVAFVKKVSQELIKKNLKVVVVHRDIQKDF